MQNTNQKQHVQMARKACPIELEQRQQEGRTKIKEGFYQTLPSGSGRWVYPAQEVFSFNSFQQCIESIVSLTKQGRKLYEHDSPVNAGTYYSVSFYKSDEELEQLYQASDIEVEEQYKQEIEEFNQAQVELLTKQLVEQELNKERKKEDERLAAIQAKAAATAAKHIQDQLKDQLKEGAK